jgi:hypothetical protein
MAVSGALGPGATLYNAPIVLTTTTRIKARMAAVDPTSASTDLTWSALTEADFIVVERESELHLTEIMYNPPAGNEYEFIELKNNGDSDFELANSFFEGIDYSFPPGTPPLPPGGFVVLASNPAALAKRYPDVSIGGAYDGQLSNAGEKISLRGPEGTVLISVEFDDESGWPVSPDGRGDSLVLIDFEGDPNHAKSWRASADLHGSPGEDDPSLTLTGGLDPSLTLTGGL